MKKYFEYMDDIQVSDTLHQRLLNLETPKKQTAAWKKYGGLAAALVLVAGAGAWGLSRGGWNAVAENFDPNAVTPEIENIGQPDIAYVEPNDLPETGMKTIGGYEVRGPENGPNTVVSYYMLPYIEYGDVGGAEMCLDWDVPKGATKKDLTQAEIMALLGGEDAVTTHLDWGGYELTGWAAWYADGSFWGAYLFGYAGPLDHFEFAVTANELPPTCIHYPDSVEQEIWGMAVTADGHDSVAGPNGGVDASDRRVTFMKDGYGYRFDLTGVSRALAEERVSRLVRWVALEGTAPDALSSDGAVLAHPWEADPNYGVGEPNWEDGVSDYDSDCPYCADGTVHTHAYDPSKAADPSYNAPN